LGRSLARECADLATVISDEELVESVQCGGEFLSFGGVGVGEDEAERVRGVSGVSLVALELDLLCDDRERLASVVGVGAGHDPAAVAEFGDAR